MDRSHPDFRGDRQHLPTTNPIPTWPMLHRHFRSLPLITSLFVHGAPRLPRHLRPPPPTHKKKPINIDLSDKKQVKQIHDHLMVWLDHHPPDQQATPEEAGDYLLSMTRASVDAVTHVLHKGSSHVKHKDRYYRGGWSPTLICIKPHLQALILIQRHATSKKCK